VPDGRFAVPGLEGVAGLLDEQAAPFDGLGGRPEHLAGGAQVYARVVGIALVEQSLRVGEVGLAERPVVVRKLV
jgi:hypothetical protein